MFSWPDPDQILEYSQFYAAMFACAAIVSGIVTFLQTFLFGVAGAKLTDRLRTMTFSNYLVQVSEHCFNNAFGWKVEFRKEKMYIKKKKTQNKLNR